MEKYKLIAGSLEHCEKELNFYNKEFKLKICAMTGNEQITVILFTILVKA